MKPYVRFQKCNSGCINTQFIYKLWISDKDVDVDSPSLTWGSMYKITGIEKVHFLSFEHVVDANSWILVFFTFIISSRRDIVQVVQTVHNLYKMQKGFVIAFYKNNTVNYFVTFLLGLSIYLLRVFVIQRRMVTLIASNRVTKTNIASWNWQW